MDIATRRRWKWKIANLVGMSQVSVSGIVRHRYKTRLLFPSGQQVGPQKEDDSKRWGLADLGTKRKTSDVLKNDLEAAGVSISSSTVCQRLIEVGRIAGRLKKNHLITVMKRIQYHWAIKYKVCTCEDWGKALFSDKSHLLVQWQCSQHVCRPVEDPVRKCNINQFVKHPAKFWGCSAVASWWDEIVAIYWCLAKSGVRNANVFGWCTWDISVRPCTVPHIEGGDPIFQQKRYVSWTDLVTHLT